MYRLLQRKWLICLLLAVSAVLMARAGGAGGESSGGGGGFDSSSGGDGGGEIIYLIWIIFRMLPFPFNLIVVALIVIVAYYAKRKVGAVSVYNGMEGTDISTKQTYQNFTAKIPGFDQKLFIGKVEKAFMEIQNAWQEQNLSAVRRYISDSVYQRFTVQFKMMQKLGQANKINALEIRNTFIDKAVTEGDYDIITVGIQAYINEIFTGKYPELDTRGDEVFTEYWVFLKKRNASADLYAGTNCPQCGAELPKEAGEISKCEYCGALTNSGEYDWVLAEIIQANDYVILERMYRKSNLDQYLTKLYEVNPDFSVQLLEDKASNAFLQILVAQATENPVGMRRFVSDLAYQKLSQTGYLSGSILNRLYINSAAVCSYQETVTTHQIAVAFKYTIERVTVVSDKLNRIDRTPVSKLAFLIMTREKSAVPPKGSLYAHLCPACGSPLADTTDLFCSYCSSQVNSPKFEWIVDDFLNENEYGAYLRNQHKDSAAISVDAIENLYDVRDYAFNNLLVILAADGQFSEEEKEFAAKTAKSMGYDADKVSPLINMAKNGSLSIYMPTDEKKRTKIIKLMEKGAAIDNRISPEEQSILDDLKQS